MTADEWQQIQDTQPKVPSEEEIREQLNTATSYLQNNQPAEALTIYNFLVPFNVPEAIYGAANLALQNKNNAIGCDEAAAMLRRASDAGNLPAKRTLGFLYMFAENEAVMSINGYTRCVFDKNFSRARLYLSQAANGGDTTARKLLNELNLNEQSTGPQ
jgi:serine/threonine-protein kinase